MLSFEEKETVVSRVGSFEVFAAKRSCVSAVALCGADFKELARDLEVRDRERSRNREVKRERVIDVVISLWSDMVREKE